MYVCMYIYIYIYIYIERERERERCISSGICINLSIARFFVDLCHFDGSGTNLVKDSCQFSGSGTNLLKDLCQYLRDTSPTVGGKYSA